jgi:hypothetical protein
MRNYHYASLKPVVVVWLITVLLASLTIRASAQRMPRQGEQSDGLTVGDKTVTCSSSGRRVVWIADYGLNDVGMTAQTFTSIRYNPRTIMGMPDRVRLFWLGHECGHAFKQTKVEEDADCWSAETGVKQNWFDTHDFDYLAEQLANSPGDSTHPPGLIRLANIKQCMEMASSVSNQAVTSETNHSTGFCDGLRRAISLVNESFSSIKGSRRHKGLWATSFTIGQFTTCEINDVADDGVLHLICSGSSDSFAEAENAVGSCLGDWHKHDFTNDAGDPMANFTSSDSGSKVSLKTNSRNDLEIWISKD